MRLIALKMTKGMPETQAVKKETGEEGVSMSAAREKKRGRERR